MAKGSDQADRFGWQDGDIEILKPGTGEPLISEEELARIIRENGPPSRGDVDDESGRPDPGFRAPDFRPKGEKPAPSKPEK
jgi:hypothetical protein